MTPDTFQIFGQIAGIGGLALCVFLSLFYTLIKKNIFPTLNQIQTYRIIQRFLMLTFTIAVIGIIAWLIPTFINNHIEEDTNGRHNSDISSSATVAIRELNGWDKLQAMLLDNGFHVSIAPAEADLDYRILWIDTSLDISKAKQLIRIARIHYPRIDHIQTSNTYFDTKGLMALVGYWVSSDELSTLRRFSDNDIARLMQIHSSKSDFFSYIDEHNSGQQ